MPDPRPTKAEREVQLKFSFASVLKGLALAGAILAFDQWLNLMPNRTELGGRASSLVFEQIQLDPSRFSPLRPAGAWTVRSDDPRIGGVSALALDGPDLVALTDSGTVVRFRPPAAETGSATIRELPGGPGDPAFKRNRDSEALAKDPSSGGWWVAFENRHELWLYDDQFRRPLGRWALRQDWSANIGIEGAAFAEGRIILFHESARFAVEGVGREARRVDITGVQGRISDAAAIGDGAIIVVERRITPVGVRNALVRLERSGRGYRVSGRIPLGLGPLDNVEALTVEQRPDGGLRLWLMTDDNFQPPLRTVLIALDWPAAKRAVR